MATTLKDQLREKDREIAMLHAISEIVRTRPDISELLKKFSDLIVQQLEADSVLIYLSDPQTDELILKGSHNPHPQQVGRIKLKLGEGITGWVAEKRKIVSIARQASEDARFKLFSNLKEDKFEAFLSVPIALKNDVLGVVNIHHRKPHAHTSSEIRMAESLAQEIADNLEHSRLYHEALTKSRQIETLARMSQSIAQGRFLREILQLIVTMTAEMMGSKICSLMLLDEKGRELRIEATQSLSEAYKTKPPVKVALSVSGRAIQERRPVVVEDVTKDPQYTYPDIARKENLRSLIVVPMMVKDKPVGVLNCYTAEMHHFNDEEIQLIQAVANQAAVAIEHTRAIEKAIEAQEALETRKLVERAKGLLMRQHGMIEEAAFRLIQRQAMDRRKSMKEVAEAIILSDEIKQTK
ncbi:MAG TPA: GAF domain-containing protein [Elusimicrobiota bacterium]|nr:GAF domain-containing protein [Elusimicrobiota bacterium]